MLKKLLLASLVCGLCFGANGTEFDWKVSDELKIYAIANNDIMDDSIAGEWYLRFFENAKYFKVASNEFEKYDAYKQGKEKLEKLKEQYKNLDTNKTYVMLTGGNFGEYNFEKEEFPIDFITERGYFELNEGKIQDCYQGLSLLVFDNVNIDKHVFKIAKDEANKFVKSRNSGSGYIDRYINIDVEFSLSKVELGEETQAMTTANSCLNIKATGHIKKLTLIDQKSQNRVLYTIEYE